MTDTRNTRADVVQAAGRLFAERGYHGTSMRDLGRELGLQGSSLYSHIRSKEDLLVDVVQRAADLFQIGADRATVQTGDERATLRALIAGHVDVLLDHVDEARTFLNEARSLDDPHSGAGDSPPAIPMNSPSARCWPAESPRVPFALTSTRSSPGSCSCRSSTRSTGGTGRTAGWTALSLVDAILDFTLRGIAIPQ
jgi:AcrR family transcriptional regulator